MSTITRTGRRTIEAGRTVVVLVAIALAGGLLGSCNQAPATPSPDPAPPKPTLIGTWTASTEWWEDDQRVGTVTTVLTFTKDRYIQHHVRRTFSGDLHDPWFDQGSWSATAKTATRIWHEWDDENRQFHPDENKLDKEFVWGNEERSVLFMENWWEDEDQDHDTDEATFLRYTRVAEPIRYPLNGRWEFAPEREADDGSTIMWRITYSLSADSFTYRNARTQGDSVRVFEWGGTYTHDRETLSVTVNISKYELTLDGEPQEVRAEILSAYIGQTLSWAYAPTDHADRIRASGIGFEQAWNRATDAWEQDNVQYPHGNYNEILTRTPSGQ